MVQGRRLCDTGKAKEVAQCWAVAGQDLLGPVRMCRLQRCEDLQTLEGSETVTGC